MQLDRATWHTGTVFVIFQISWFVCVMGAAAGKPWLAPLAMAVLIAVHLTFTARPARELWLISWAGLLGLVLDSWPVALGLVAYPSGTMVVGIAPYWILTMWLGFATLLNVCLRWLRGRYLLGTLLGAVGGALSFQAGEALGAVVFLAPTTIVLAAQALNWTLATPLLLWLASRFDGVETDPGVVPLSGSGTANKPG